MKNKINIGNVTREETKPKYITTHEELLKLHGRKVTCKIDGVEILNAIINVENNNRVYICHSNCNKQTHSFSDSTLGLLFSYATSANNYKYEETSRTTEIQLLEDKEEEAEEIVKAFLGEEDEEFNYWAEPLAEKESNIEKTQVETETFDFPVGSIAWAEYQALLGNKIQHKTLPREEYIYYDLKTGELKNQNNKILGIQDGWEIYKEPSESVTDIDVGNKLVKNISGTEIKDGSAILSGQVRDITDLELFKEGKAFVSYKSDMENTTVKKLCELSGVDYQKWTYTRCSGSDNYAFIDNYGEIAKFYAQGYDNMLFRTKEQLRRFLTEIKGMKEVSLEALQEPKTMTLKEAIQYADEHRHIKVIIELLSETYEIHRTGLFDIETNTYEYQTVTINNLKTKVIMREEK